MIPDVLTIMWKEWKEVLLQRSGMRRGWLNVLLMVAVFGVFLPLQAGAAWVTSPVVLGSWAWVPIMLVTNIIADSFAGERERHTLETLLASRLPDTAILLGKMLAGVAYAWGVTLASLILGVITVNLAHWEGRLVMYPPHLIVGGVGISLLTAALAAGVGVLVSLRASTVRQAQQTLGMATLLVVWVPILAMGVLPASWQQAIGRGLQAADSTGALLGAMVALAAVDVVLVAAARARFRRARLILD
ncbi:MAG: ABC transporter permease [Anaerolineae bacterium]|nr:ABC transporter permease [Anaerolineae bacterium]